MGALGVLSAEPYTLTYLGHDKYLVTFKESYIKYHQDEEWVQETIPERNTHILTARDSNCGRDFIFNIHGLLGGCTYHVTAKEIT